MAITKVTNNGVADNAITSDKISDGSISNNDLGATLDLSSKTVTLPSASVTAHATNPTKSSIEALGINVPATKLTGIKTVGGVSIAGSGDISVDTVTKSASDPAIDTNGAVGDQWVNTTSGEMFVCIDATIDANIWQGQNGTNINPTEPPEFETVLYTGNGGNQTINLNHITDRVDFFLVSVRNAAWRKFFLNDTVRGITNNLTFTESSAENSYANGLSSTANGSFTLNNNQADYNASGYSFVAWCATLPHNYSNTSGSINSTVRTNGWLSVITYTGNGSNGQTVPHNLESEPGLTLIKPRNFNDNWVAATKLLGGVKKAYLNSDSNFSSDSRSSYDANNLLLDAWNNVNDPGDTYVAYAFASVEGRCKVGVYTGTGASGNAITTGFQTGCVIIKRANSSGHWTIWDNARGTNKVLFLNNHYSEETQSRFESFDSNGFTVQGSHTQTNASGETYLYVAIAAY